MNDLTSLTPRELLMLHAEITEELRGRGVTRSSNNPGGDWAEALFCRAFGWKQAPRSAPLADATDDAGIRYQIKSRRLTVHRDPRQLNGPGDLSNKGFDVLAAVLFEHDYQVRRAALIPYLRVVELSTRSERRNKWRFILRDSVWSLDDVQDVTAELKQAESSWVPEMSSSGR